jgi:hypothetical protein
MIQHQFMLKLNRDITAEEIQALTEVGCDDATVETRPLGTFLVFSRAAPTLAEAVVSAALDIEKICGLRAVGVNCENLVNLRGIANMAGVTHEAVRLWATGRRNPSAFPNPIIITPGGERIWDCEDVVDWLRQNKGRARRSHRTKPADVRLRALSTAHYLLAAREGLSRESDQTARELERLLREGYRRSTHTDPQAGAG